MTGVSKPRYVEARPSGRGRPQGTLVLIHAFPLNAHMWEPQLALADRGWHVVAPQLTGLGEGTDGPPATSIDDFAGDVVDVLDALRVEEAVVGGLSMGGYAAFALFRRAPRYFRGLILADTRSEADTPQALAGRRHMLEVIAERGTGGVADEMVPKLLGATTQRDRADVAARVRTLIAANRPDGIAGAVRALMTRPDSGATLGTIHCPTLIVVGEEDMITPPALSRDMQRRIAQSELVVIGGAGHLSSLEAPDAFNAALAHFLDHRV
jgi:pimeloyl-ACP methyl ester carboxylesterase